MGGWSRKRTQILLPFSGETLASLKGRGGKGRRPYFPDIDAGGGSCRSEKGPSLLLELDENVIILGICPLTNPLGLCPWTPLGSLQRPPNPKLNRYARFIRFAHFSGRPNLFFLCSPLFIKEHISHKSS